MQFLDLFLTISLTLTLFGRIPLRTSDLYPSRKVPHTCYSAAYKSHAKRFTISEAAVDWRELMIPHYAAILPRASK